jgi:hypothetical protein
MRRLFGAFWYGGAYALVGERGSPVCSSYTSTAVPETYQNSSQYYANRKNFVAQS